MDMKETDRIVYLLRRHIEGILTEDEQHELDIWTDVHPSYHNLLDEISEPKTLLGGLSEFDSIYGEDPDTTILRIKRQIDAKIAKQGGTMQVLRPPMQWRKYAAAMVICLIAGTILWSALSGEKDETPITTVVDIEPGGKKAILTLSDGSQINLREDQGSVILGGENIHYSDGSSVITDGKKEIVHDDSRQMSITVPQGGTYQVVLSDGTKVWLNSSSVLRYPEHFTTSERIVELEGEAYFEVSSVQREGRKYPFVVKTSQQKIQVLGTQFNVSAYNDQRENVTTLVKGRVSILPNGHSSDHFQLGPGHQSIVTENNSSIQTVDVEQYVAWKDDLFYFKNTSFADMMRQISRWYDIEVIYRDKIPNDTFTGKMSRDLSLLTVLELLNVSSMSIQIKEGRLIVN